MITIMTINEFLLYTNWDRGPEGDMDYGLCELMSWDERITDDFDLVRSAAFDAQLLAIPDGLARYLGIIADTNPFANGKAMKRTERGYSIYRAHQEELALIDKLIIHEKWGKDK